MTIDRRLLDILCCPATKVPVRLLDKATLAELNRVISEGKVVFREGSVVKAPLQEALITDDKRTVYAIEDSIPIMLEPQGIATEQPTLTDMFTAR
jgi:uncharacterized protein